MRTPAEEFDYLLDRYFETFGEGPALRNLPLYAERNAALQKALDTGEKLEEPKRDDRVY
jgi:hypothetical protein